MQKKHGLVRYKRTSRDKRGDILWKYLGGDQCDRNALMLRGRRLHEFLTDYKEAVYELHSVQQLLSSRLVIGIFRKTLAQ